MKRVVHITFEQLLSINESVEADYLYDNCFLSRTVSIQTANLMLPEVFSLDAYMVVICSYGEVDFLCDMQKYKLAENSFFIYKPGMVMQLDTVWPSTLYLLIFKKEFLRKLLINIDQIILPHWSFHDGFPLLFRTTNISNLLKLTDCVNMAIESNHNNLYYHESVHTTVAALLSKIVSEIYEDQNNNCRDKSISREMIHFNNFMHLLSKYHTMHHNVRFYSDKLCISPKHLSIVVKHVSGESVTSWIQKFVIRTAKNLIKNTNMTVQEISNELHFPNQSFFTKYFRNKTGITPSAYREKP